MSAPPIVLVPGFWLGAWAWDGVVTQLRSRGHQAMALTLPGLESVDTDLSTITLADHVDAICAAVAAQRGRVVLAVHSGAAVAGYAASDRVPERIAAMVYVDTAPAAFALDPKFEGAEMPLPSREDLERDESLTGLTVEQLETFRRRAVPEPGGAIRDSPRLTNEARLDLPSIIVCTGFTAEQYKEAAKKGYAWVSGLNELRDVEFVELPTSHWPMWSRTEDLARILGEIADSHSA